MPVVPPRSAADFGRFPLFDINAGVEVGQNRIDVRSGNHHASTFLFGKDVDTVGKPVLKTSRGAVVPVDHNVSMQHRAIRLRIPVMNHNFRVLRIHMLDVLGINPADVDAVFNVVVFQLGRLATGVDDLTRQVDIEVKKCPA